jgi:hypothetical protein
LERTPNPVMTREAVARGIMDAAKQGERDVERLRDAGPNGSARERFFQHSR